MRILLHIGAWKTGSSAIQFFMSRSADALRAHGTVTPAAAVNALGRSDVLRALCGSDEDTAPLMREMSDLKAAGARTLVISNEHYWPLSAEQVQQIGARLKQISDEVETLMYIRPQDDMWRSLHSQQAKKFYVKPGAAVWGTADYLPPVFAERALYYHRTLQIYADVFGQENTFARLYDRNRFVGGDVVTDFLSYLGHDWTVFEREERDINRSVGWKGVAFAVWLANEAQPKMQAQNPDRIVGNIYIRTVKRTADKFGGDWIGRAADPMTSEDKALIRQHYAEDNARLFADYFDGEDIFGPAGEGRGDVVEPEAIPRPELRFAQRRFLRIANQQGFNVDGVDHLFEPPRRQVKPVSLMKRVVRRFQKA